MMKGISYIWSAALASALMLAGCSKDGYRSAADDSILFRVNTPEVTLTKGEVTEETIETASVVKVYETAVSEGALYNGSLLTPEMNGSEYTGVWKPISGSTWSNYEYDNLSFHAIAYSPENAETNGLTIKSKGHEIAVSQPHSYDPSSNIDFLLAKEVRVPTDLARKKVIPLNLEHAMAKVELYVYCADAMANDDDITITIDQLNIEGIHTDLTMIYAPQSTVEKWSRKDYGQADATYTLPAGFEVKARNGENLTDNLAMGFIAVPVDKADMEAVLNIRYSVSVASVNDGTPVEFEASFDLSDHTSLGWMSNHKVKYELVIDTGISLKGRITDWIEVDYIEGIVLPEIKEEQ